MDVAFGARDLEQVTALAAEHIERRRGDRVSNPVDAAELRERIAAFTFETPRAIADAAAALFDLLRETGVRTDHPRYFGLFNPPSLVPAIAGDIVAATVNPQLAVWEHAPAAAEIERHLINLFGSRIWNLSEAAGTFTSGGSEANHTAVLAALAKRYPDWAEKGIAGLPRRPVIYVSAQAHLAWIKIARAVGLGAASVRLVPTLDGLALDGDSLAKTIDANPDCDPFLVVATAGTTAHGAVDDLEGIAAVGRAHGAHVHVDAAWAGAILLSRSHRALLSGIDLADSVTIDPHKWLAVPMGAGLYVARDWAPLQAAFDVATGYMPSASVEKRDAYLHSLQWSRRFNGAKLFLALATLGLDGYEQIMSRQFALGDRLRDALRADRWRIVNRTALPLVCFVPEEGGEAVNRIERQVIASGGAWISRVLFKGEPCLRACITGFETCERDVAALIELLSKARRESLSDG